MNGEEHGKNSQEPNVDLFYRVTGTYGCWRDAEIAAVIWSRQVDAAAGVGEDRKTRGGGGGGGGARAQHSGERKKMEVASDWRSIGPGYL